MAWLAQVPQAHTGSLPGCVLGFLWLQHGSRQDCGDRGRGGSHGQAFIFLPGFVSSLILTGATCKQGAVHRWALSQDWGLPWVCGGGEGVPFQCRLIFKRTVPVQQQGKVGSHPGSSASQHATLDKGVALSLPALVSPSVEWGKRQDTLMVGGSLALGLLNPARWMQE